MIGPPATRKACGGPGRPSERAAAARVNTMHRCDSCPVRSESLARTADRLLAECNEQLIVSECQVPSGAAAKHHRETWISSPGAAHFLRSARNRPSAGGFLATGCIAKLVSWPKHQKQQPKP